MFDSHCDLAAMVYGQADDPDSLLREFADDVKRAGYRPVGLIQCTRGCGANGGPVSVRMLPENNTIQLTHNLGRYAEGCGLDLGALIDAAMEVATAIERGADLVVVNRFGKMELAGKGLVEEIGHALSADIPVLVAVPEKHFTTWTKFSGGMGVKLHCSRGHLDAWWRSIHGGSEQFSPASLATLCEIVK